MSSNKTQNHEEAASSKQGFSSSKAISMVLAACFVVSIGVTAHVMGAFDRFQGRSAGAGSGGYVVIDMIRIEVAQQQQITQIMGESLSSGDMGEAFRAAGDVKRSAMRVAGGRDIKVKQAFLSTSAPDITDQVLDDLGLPNPGSSEQAERQFFETNEPTIPDQVQEYAEEHENSMRQQRSISPYGG